jgi:hypothetical protein
VPQQIRQAGGEAKKTAGELASQGRDVGQTADKELKQAGDQAADQVMIVFCAPVEDGIPTCGTSAFRVHDRVEQQYTYVRQLCLYSKQCCMLQPGTQ